MFTWFKIFREHSLMEQTLAHFKEMVEAARCMFETMGKALLDGADPSEVAEAFDALDLALAKTEQDTRKLIIEHLSINPANDLGASLVFFSGIRDAERLGDYCKELREISHLHKGRTFPEPYLSTMRDHFNTIGAQFDKTAQAFTNMDQQMARSVIDSLSRVEKSCHENMVRLIKEPSGLAAEEAIALALALRYMERIAGHIGNIAGSISQTAL